MDFVDSSVANVILATSSYLMREDPNKCFSLSVEKYIGLRYVKIKHKSVEYRAVYDINDEHKEVLIIFLGTRENFYKELKRYLG